ncbi:MAG: efflux RND transporter periplasmic adaptor subunit [Deltaproteobacteria bacterium]|nr:efflux RND transporter periplasmic adaptor subunit [Deltaproteobacteria bacterium]MBW2172526.1 efflux RND transporter periplasmic adaptor subunit [Deltaproteobacteria bacterium]
MMQQRIAFVLALLVIILPLACSEEIEPGTTTKTSPVVSNVAVGTVHMADQQVMYEAVGTVQAGITSDLASKLLGTVEAVQVREGDQVKEGDPLVIIDQRQVKAAFRGAEAGLAETNKALAAAISTREAEKAQSGLARATYERFVRLRRDGSVSQQEFEEIQARHQEAEASLKRAEAMVAAATARISRAEAALTTADVASKDAVITAPHDGVITRKLIDKGDLARPGTPLLTLETTNRFCVDMVIPEMYIGYIRPEQKVLIRVPALQAEPLEGTVCTIVPSADPRSRSFVVKVRMPIDIKARSGMFARVQVPTGQAKTILVARRAVVRHGQLTGFYLVDADNTARFRLIRTGKTYGDSIEVLSGLKTGDRYVLEPTPELQDGSRVEVAQ